MNVRHRAVRALACISALTTGTALASPPLLTRTLVTRAASTEMASLCNGGSYPAQWTWNPGEIVSATKSATSGTPRIDQVRGGRVIATYSSFASGPDCSYIGNGTDWRTPGVAAATGCGPFTREHAWRLWAPGDTFLVYPAVYSGDDNQPWIGPGFTGDLPWPQDTVTPSNLTIQGVVQNGVRPVIRIVGGASNNTLGQGVVYFDQSVGVTFSDVDVDGTAAEPGRALVYADGGQNLSLVRMHVHGAQYSNNDGIFATPQNSGTFLLDSIEMDHNGGDNGPAHNVYVNASASDPNYTFQVMHSYSHDAVYGHLLKSRAQRTILVGNYFQGGVPQGGQFTQAEAYGVDIPNGGVLGMVDNILVKSASGFDSNGFTLAYAEEGVPDSRQMAIDVEHNTFVAFAATFDGSHPNVPAWIAIQPPNSYATNNAFAGFCPTGNPRSDYRGDVGLTEALSELGQDFGLALEPYAGQGGRIPILGMPLYGHVAIGGGHRVLPTIGARD